MEIVFQLFAGSFYHDIKLKDTPIPYLKESTECYVVVSLELIAALMPKERG